MRLRGVAAAGISVALAALASCRASPPPAATVPARTCSVVVWHNPQSASAHVELVGDWNDWARPGLPMSTTSYPGWLATSVTLTPGEHLYSIIEDGNWLIDPTVPTTGYYDGTEVTWIDVADCSTPGLQIDDAAGSATGAATVQATFLSASTHDPIEPSSIVVTAHDGTTVTPASVAADASTGVITLTFAGLPPGKHSLTVAAKDVKGRAADPAWATAWIEPQPWDPRDMFLYQIMVDRYRGDGDTPLVQPSIPSARAGGTIAGVTAAIENGDFARLGVNALWVTPLYLNPTGWFPGLDGKPYSSYHGYWPIDERAIEPALGAESDVDALIASAHAHDMRVLFDVVPNHVHEQNPYSQQHLNGGWFNHPDGTCICGDPTCDWTTHITDCWFINYLPDLDWRNQAVADQLTSDVQWWIDRFDADGIRIDAVPMMVRAATRRVAAALRAKYEHPVNTMFLLGENFVGQYDFDLLKYQLGPFGLNSEFHFPLMWALRGAIADQNQPMSAIDAAVQGGITDWAGSGAVMTTLIGNHDVDRFASESAGDGDGDPWTPAVQPPPDSDIYARQVLALGAVFSLPGAPVVYYGDDVALVGHYDPDSRHVMPADSALNSAQSATRQSLGQLAKVRACSAALRQGTYRTLLADDEHLVYARELSGADTAVVVLFRNASTLSASFPGIAAGTWVDALSGQAQSLSPELTNVVGAPLSLQLLFPQGSACANSAQ
jgi:glycosidase